VSRLWCVHSVSCTGVSPECKCHHASRREAGRLLSGRLAVTIKGKHLRLLPAEMARPEPIKVTGSPIPATVDSISGGNPVLGPFISFVEQRGLRDGRCCRCGSLFTTNVWPRRLCDKCAAMCSRCKEPLPFRDSLHSRLCDCCAAECAECRATLPLSDDRRNQLCEICALPWCRCGSRARARCKRLCADCWDMRQARWCQCGERLVEKRKRLCPDCRSVPRAKFYKCCKQMQDVRKAIEEPHEFEAAA
jgi:hypothetical protein